MNNYTLAIGSFVRFNAVVLNTLEYVMKKPSYEVNAYKARKEAIKNEVTQNTPLKQCLMNSKEAGEKLLEKINELQDTVYGDSSTIVKLSQDGNELRVDQAQHLAVFNLVLPIYEEVRNIITAHINAAKKENQYNDESLANTIAKTDYFYHGLVNMLLLDELDHLFAEYNKARNEAKGAITPQSNFIQNDINEVVKLFNLLRQRSQVTSSDYYELIDPLFALLEMTSGRRDLPQGKNFGDMFTQVKTTCREKTMKWESEWKPVYDKFMKEFNEAIQEAIRANVAKA